MASVLSDEEIQDFLNFLETDPKEILMGQEIKEGDGEGKFSEIFQEVGSALSDEEIQDLLEALKALETDPEEISMKEEDIFEEIGPIFSKQDIESLLDYLKTLS